MKNKCSIYILETNEKLRNCLEVYIKSLSWLKLCGSSNRIDNSINLLLKLKPNILILNNVMSISSNANLFDKVKMLSKYCNIYIISGSLDSEIIEFSYKLGIKKYIKKPCDFYNIFNIIQSDMIKSEL